VADIAVNGVDTRGVVGTAVVTAVVDVHLAVVAVITCTYTGHKIYSIA